MRFVTDYENNGEVWWSAARSRATECPSRRFADWLETLDDEITLPSKEGERVLVWCQGLPGWEDGPAHARCPLVVED